MKINFQLSVILAGLLGCCSGARADSPAKSGRPMILPVKNCVVVKEIKGFVEYAYDGTGWRLLEAGKRLKAGATIRAAAGSAAVVRVDERASFMKVSPATMLHITMETPAEELRPKPMFAAAFRAAE